MQAIGRAAYNAGFEGLIVPSHAFPDGVNVVVVRERLSRPSRQLTVLNKRDLNRLRNPPRGA